MDMFFTDRKSRREKTLEKCRKMREAKERKRLAMAVAVERNVIAAVTFEGPMFGGTHVVRFVGHEDRPVVDVEVDGRVTCVKTPRGARALVMRRIAREVRECVSAGVH
jgi:hypothetical protein